MDTMTQQERAEWRAWLALSEDERRRRIARARDEVDAEGYTTTLLLAPKALRASGVVLTTEDVAALRYFARNHYCIDNGQHLDASSEAGRRLSAVADLLTRLIPPDAAAPDR